VKSTHNPGPARRYTRFCGIDVAKRTHVACIIDRDGQSVLTPRAFNNSAEGFQRLLERLRAAGGPSRVSVGMEATAHYWYSPHDFLVRQGYQVAVLNPIQTAQQARQGLRRSKTDKIDAAHIAVLLKNGQYRPAIVPGELAMSCRQLTRLRYVLVTQDLRLQNLLRARVHPIWPEYDTLFADPFRPTGCQLLMLAPTPADLLALDSETLVDLIRKTSRGKYGPAKAEQIRQAAQHSVGMQRGLEGTRVCIRSLLTQLEALRTMRRQLEAHIATLAERIPAYVRTLPGADAVRAVSLFGETDPIETFRSPGQLVAFAGLEPKVFQTGEYEAPRRRISKRGSPYLRRTLWLMALATLPQEGASRDYWLRRRRAGMHHLAAVTAIAARLCRVAWRILTDRRDYLPQAPQPTTGATQSPANNP
jgi:transposase